MYVNRFRLIWVLVLAVTGSAAAQDAPPPVFRAGVEALVFDVTVLNAQGQRIPELSPADFTVTIAGRARKVVSTRLYGADDELTVTPRPEVADSAVARHTRGAGGGRLVLFAVDRESIQGGSERVLLEGAGRVIDSLTPADAGAVITVPGGSFEPTREHSRVREALRRMTGTMPVNMASWYITWDEARGIERGDTSLLRLVAQRECGMTAQLCTERDIATEAGQMLLAGRSRARSLLANLGTIIEGLAKLRGPKHLVLLSGGVLFEQSMLSEYNQLGRQAAGASVLVHVVHVDQAASDVATARRTVTSPFGGRELSHGLSTIAAITGGGFHIGVGSGAGAFERIASEIGSTYQLGIETSPADADGQARDISVSVNRPNVTTRTRPQIALAHVPSAAARAMEPTERLLQQPTDLVGLPIEVATYTTRGDDPDRVRVVVTAEISSGRPGAAGEWAFTVLHEGNAVATGQRVVEATVEPWVVTASTKLVPGRYRLRFAAKTAEGRSGVVDVPITAGLRLAGELQLSDVMVGIADAGRLVPRRRIPSNADVRVLIELMSGDRVQLEQSRAVLDILQDGSVEPVKRYAMGTRTGPSDSILLSEASVPAGALTPGRYTASVTVISGGRPLGRVSRVFEVGADGQ